MYDDLKPKRFNAGQGPPFEAAPAFFEERFMRRTIPGLVIASLLVLSAPAHAAGHIHVKDGDDWLTWDPVMKTAFVDGFKAGGLFVIRNGDSTDLPIPETYDAKKAGRIERAFYDACKTPGAKNAATFKAGDVIVLMAGTRAKRDKSMAGLDVSAYSTTQIVDGIDSFYEHYENRHVGLADAIDYVRKEIDNAPAEDLARIENYLRSGKERADLLTVYDGKGRVKKVIAYP